MKWCFVVPALWCAAASAQVLDQNASKLDPYQQKALDNALRNPKVPATNTFAEPFAQLPPLSGPGFLSPKPSAAREVAKACAIPLRSLPANSKIDPGIRRKLAPDAFSIDHMPAAKGLPVCRPGDTQAR
jgi:hypothetical protein